MPNEISQLGTTEIQIKRTATGDLQAVKGIVRLSFDSGDMIEIKGKAVISASGYDKLNQVAGLSLVMPKRIEVPRYGSQPNPFFVINPDVGSVEFVMVKMSAIGHSPIGSLCIVDQTLLFDLKAYLKMDAIAKVKYNKSLGKIACKANLTEEENRFGMFLPIMDGGFGIWLDTRHEEFFKLVSEAQQRQRFAERIALGIVKRNCLRHHPAIAASIVIPKNGLADVTVIGYRHELTEERMREMVDGKRDSTVETIENVFHTDDIDVDDVTSAGADSTIEEAKQQPVEVSSAPELTKREKLMIRIDEYKCGVLLPDEWEEFYKNTVKSGRKLSEFNDQELEKFEAVLAKYVNTRRE
jgi:hypothetical protein